jgi:putative membrane protein
MRQYILGGALALALPAIGFAQSAAPPAAQYVMMAGQSDQFEMQSARLAVAKGSPAVRNFGHQMLTDHMKSTIMVTAAARKSGLSVSPPELTTDQQAMLDQLKGESGDAFDKTYVDQQVTAHQQALALQKAYADSGDDTNLKAAAAHIEPVVETHLSLLQSMVSH